VVDPANALGIPSADDSAAVAAGPMIACTP
jgi:hypothetical protein